MASYLGKQEALLLRYQTWVLSNCSFKGSQSIGNGLGKRLGTDWGGVGDGVGKGWGGLGFYMLSPPQKKTFKIVRKNSCKKKTFTEVTSQDAELLLAQRCLLI